MSGFVDLPPAVTAWLNDPVRSWSLAFTAVSTRKLRKQLESETGLLVSVVPLTREITRSERNTVERRYAIGIVIRKKLTADTEGSGAANTEENGLINLVEEIEDKLAADRTLNSLGFDGFDDETNSRPVFNFDLYDEQDTFQSLLICNFLRYSEL